MIHRRLFGGFDFDPEQCYEEFGVTHVLLSCLVEMSGERLSGGCQVEIGTTPPEAYY